MDTSNAIMAGRVEDQDYYHINRCVSWSPYQPLKVGDEKIFGGSNNPYFTAYETRAISYPLSNKDGSINKVPGVTFLEYVLSGKVNAPPDFAHFAHALAKHLAGYMGELTLEDVRRREFPHLPSRQRCIWLCPNQNGVRYWLRRKNRRAVSGLKGSGPGPLAQGERDLPGFGQYASRYRDQNC